jgi:succinate dehydrogenase / fumarate reductase cytochrome b subunit
MQFYLRRLHSLTGLFLGLFLFNHFLTNSFMYEGPDAFNHKVHFIHYIPFLLLVEFGLVFAPFLFHGAYGIYLMWPGSNRLAYNNANYRYGRNWMYAIQRLTAWILAIFVVWHVAEFRFYYKEIAYPSAYNAEGEFVLGIAFMDNLIKNFSNPLYVLAYALGVGAAIVHWANGLCTFCMSWGITVGPESQKRFIPVAVVIAGAYALLISKAFYALLIKFAGGLPEAAMAALHYADGAKLY